jgi:hypothetical protein
VISLPSSVARALGAAYTPRCECASIRPGVTNLPVPSTTRAPPGAVTLASAPSASIAPLLRTIAPSVIVWPSAVMIVAWRITMTGAFGLCTAASRSRVGRRLRAGASPVGSTQLSATSSVGGSGLAGLAPEPMHAASGKTEASANALIFW